MRRPILLLALLGALMAAPTAQADNPPPPPPIPAPGVHPGITELIAVPAYVHSGDTIYISGHLPKPRTQYDLFIACPNLLGDTYQLGNTSWVPTIQGPVTDGQGNFVRFPIKALVLHKIRESGCVIYTDDGSTQFGPDIPGNFYIYPKRKQLPTCAVQICAGISLTPEKVRSGQYARIRIGPSSKAGYTSLPGARAVVTVPFAGGKSIKTSVALNWEGMGTVSIRVPPDTAAPSEAQIHVTYHMGRYSGQELKTLSIVK